MEMYAVLPYYELWSPGRSCRVAIFIMYVRRNWIDAPQQPIGTRCQLLAVTAFDIYLLIRDSSVPKLQPCLGVEWKIRAPKRQCDECEWKIWNKIVNMNLINVKKCGDFRGIALMVLFSQSPISKHQLRAGNSPLRAEVRVEIIHHWVSFPTQSGKL